MTVQALAGKIRLRILQEDVERWLNDPLEYAERILFWFGAGDKRLKVVMFGGSTDSGEYMLEIAEVSTGEDRTPKETSHRSASHRATAASNIVAEWLRRDGQDNAD